MPAKRVDSQAKAITEVISSREIALQDVFDRQISLIITRFDQLLRKYPLDTFEGTDKIKPTGKNLTAAARVLGELFKEVWPGYVLEGWQGVDTSIRAIEKLNSEWFGRLVPGFTNRPIYKDVTANAIAITNINFTRDVRASNLELPIHNVVHSYIRTGGEISRMKDILERSLKGLDPRGTGPDGALYRQFRQYRNLNGAAQDIMYNYTRTHSEIIGESLGLEWFYYSGGTVDDTRSFCKARRGQYWHIEEARKEWVRMDWKGKHYDTTADTIISFLGGYNCRHQAIYSTVDRVPLEAKLRASQKGYYDLPKSA